MKSLIKILILSCLQLTLLAPQSYANSCHKSYDQLYVDDQTWGLQVYDVGLNQLLKHFNNAKTLSDAEKIEYFLSSDARVIFFRLQSLSRIYDKEYDVFFSDYKDFFKKFEDLFGKVDLYSSLTAVATRLKEKTLITHFNELKQEASKNLLLALEQEGFTSNPEKKIAELKKSIASFDDWKKPLKDKKIHIKRLISESERLIKDIKDRKFSEDDIELGLHELRRRVRWLVIHVQTLNGLTQYQTQAKLPSKTESWFEEMLSRSPKLLYTSFLKMRDPDIADPIIIPQKLHAMLSTIVSNIGTEKDKAETQIFILEALKHQNLSAAKIKELETALLTITGKSEIDHKALSISYQEKIESSELLENFIENLKALNTFEK